MQKLSEIQIGKQGINENFIETLKNNFKKHENVRIRILKSGGHDKEKVRKYSEEILQELGKNYTARIIGFKIMIKKWRKPRR